MKIVIAPDSFKESLSALEVSKCIETGFRHIFPEAEYHLLPLADGGEGTVDVLLHSLQGEVKRCLVTDPIGTPIQATWAVLDGGQTALIEIAAASGLDKVEVGNRNPTKSTCFGTGELIKAALDSGVTKIMLGLGGSASNDGGAGILEALGGKLVDANGDVIGRGGEALLNLNRIDLSGLHPRCRDVEFVVACDVSNPLCGEHGASAVFGPQKGATSEQVIMLDHALSTMAQVAAEHLDKNHSETPGFGAAGGAALGLSLAFNIELISGIDMVLDAVKVDSLLEDCHLLLTGEGKIDNQTLQGKTPYGIASRAKARNIPVIAVSGSVGRDVDNLYQYMDCLFGTVRSPAPLSQVLEEAQANVTNVSRNIASTLKLGQQLKS
ncbi:glycerate kinase (plasmid) [Vibrio sp. qd031]|uniref:glycerate kinase family protein n=1 Tax=Vibrio sp. qd031 TaxID=1603038 RepID=UPI000A1002EF|nr:glycerate kinase [Vibrio sp. qd031]ORT52428.1 glycerate kinase [Vibrio sp. qd031]